MALHVGKLGPLRDTMIPLKPLTLLTGPPARGKTFILNAIFNELLPADLELVAACLLGTGKVGPGEVEIGDALSSLQKTGVVEVNVELDEVSPDTSSGGPLLRLRELRLCVSPANLKRALSGCLKGQLLPGDSEFRLTLGRSNYGLLDLFSETLEAALKSNSFERESGGRYCLSIRGIGKPIPAEEELENIRKLAGMMEETFPELASQISKAALLAEILRAGEKVEEIAAFMSRLQGVLSHIERRLRVYGLLRPVYAWTGRGLLSLMVLEGMLDPDSVGAALLAPLLPAFGFTRALARGASMLDTPELPDSARLLLELSSPVIVHPLHRGSGGKLYLDLNGTAVPVRMAHGSALSLASLILAAAPLLKAGGGVVLVDEVEHMLHPSSQAIAALLLLAMAGAGLTVVASTHSTAVATVIARLSQARSEEEARCLAARLYKRLGFRAPSGEALGLAARGARRGSAVYVVDGGHARLSQRPLEWIDRLSDTWAELGSWAASEC